MIGRALTILRTQGPVSLGYKILGELGCRRLYLYRDRLTETLSLPDTEADLDVGLLSADEADEHAALVPEISRDEVLQRLRDGHVCTTGRLDGELVAITWTAAERAWVEYLGIHIRLPERTVYGYQTYVRREHRRKGASIDLIRKRRRQLVELGYEIEVAGTMPENSPALRFQAALQREEIGVLRALGFGAFRKGWARFTVRPPPFEVE